MAYANIIQNRTPVPQNRGHLTAQPVVNKPPMGGLSPAPLSMRPQPSVTGHTMAQPVVNSPQTGGLSPAVTRENNIGYARASGPPNIPDFSGRFSTLRDMAIQGYSGKGFTGSPENIAQLTGKDYVNPRTGVVTPNIGGPTWQQVDAGASPYGQGRPAGGGDLQTGGFAGGLDPQGVPLPAQGTPGEAPMDLTDTQKDGRWGINPETGIPYGASYSQSGGVPGAVTAATDLAGVYQNQLGREPDEAGMAFYQDKIDRGEMSFEQARQEIIKSEEGRGYNTEREQYIADAYQKEFGRPVDPEGMDFYMNNPDQLAGLGGALDYSPEAVESGTASRYGGTRDDRVNRDQDLYGAQAAENTMGEATTAANEEIQAAVDESVKVIEDAAAASEEPLDPYSEAGQAALNMINDLTGVNGPEAQQAAMDAYQASPALAAKLKQTEDAMARMASATGQLGSGNLLKGLQENALTLHDQEFQQYLDNLNKTAGGGLTAGTNLAAMRFRRGQDIADIKGRAGESMSGNLYNTGILSSQRKFEMGNILAEDAFKTSGELSDLELQRAETITNYMNQGQQYIDDLMSGTLGAVTGAQMDWLQGMNAADKEFAQMIAGIWANQTNNGATDPGGSSLMGMLESFIAGAEAGEKIEEILK